jgi:NAD(P)-dependent dehydrogenase (short-subunit alcohol dehydrogenase family)
MSSYDLSGKVALITGSGRGIGLAVAARLARDGSAVVLADWQEEVALAGAQSLVDQGFQATGMACDAGDRAAVDKLIDATLEQFGRLDIVFNNAGIMGRTAPLWELDDEDWDEVIRVDLSSVFYVCRAAIRHMRSRGTGCIINMASIAGKEGTPNLVPYSVAKAGIIAFTKALGKEVIREGIRVNCVAPGVIQTPLLDQLPQEAIDIMLSKAPMGRFGTAEEVAAVVHFLASDDASFVTAQCFDVSGGRATY